MFLFMGGKAMFEHKLIVSAMIATCCSVGSVQAEEVATKPTFTKDVLPILQENCQDCHRPSGLNSSGMIAPMSLMNYKEVRPWSKAIAKMTANKSMPPWHASEEFNGVFHEERSLTKLERETILKWTEQGAKRGNPADAPAPVEFSDGGWHIKPDLIVSFDEPFFVGDDESDLQVDVWGSVPEGTLTEDKWIKSIEFRPGSDIVHHYIAYETTKNPDGKVVDKTGAWITAGAPGTTPFAYPEGYGVKFNKDSGIRFNMHYFKEVGPSTGTWDQSSFAMEFQDKPVTHPITIAALSGVPDFEIPPNAKNWRVGGQMTYKKDAHIISYAPHTHFRGAAAKYTAFYPDGTSELLFEAPRYEYAWQVVYSYKKLKEIPAGTRIEWEVIYNNSEAMAEKRGFDPTQTVNNGLRADDEMAIGFHSFAYAEPVDPSKTD
jgi:hypothetical protein